MFMEIEVIPNTNLYEKDCKKCSYVAISDNPNRGSNVADNMISHIRQVKHSHNANGSLSYCRMFQYIQTPICMRV